MKDSIETIWKEGFTKDDALTAPQVADLYNQKSRNIVDKLEYMFEINQRYVIGLAVFLLVLLVANGAPLLGIFYVVLLMYLVKVGKEEQKTLALIDKNVNSYAYIKAFDDWLKGSVVKYTNIYRFQYPMFFLSGMIQLRFSDIGQLGIDTILKDFPETFLILGTPSYLVLAVAVITSLFAYFAGILYRLDMNLVYGPMFKKLDQIIVDMEELRR